MEPDFRGRSKANPAKTGIQQISREDRV